jgi:Transposase DDE domain
MLSLLDIFCPIDDFCQETLAQMRAFQLPAKGARQRKRSLCQSEIITLLVAFQISGYRDFKTFYLGCICQNHRAEFPGLVAYNRFIEFVPSVLILLHAYLKTHLGTCTEISFLDSTKLEACHDARRKSYKTLAGQVARGKTSTGWFFGFKLHLVFNDIGEILDFRLTPGNVDDRKPVPDLLKKIFGKVYADKGYVSKALFATLFEQGVELITKRKKGMKPAMMRLWDRLMLRKRALAETIIDQLKNICQVQHTRHRAASGFLANLFAALTAYCLLPKKPSLHLREGLKKATA